LDAVRDNCDAVRAGWLVFEDGDALGLTAVVFFLAEGALAPAGRKPERRALTPPLSLINTSATGWLVVFT